jgi:hypothetical protein
VHGALTLGQHLAAGSQLAMGGPAVHGGGAHTGAGGSGGDGATPDSRVPSARGMDRVEASAESKAFFYGSRANSTTGGHHVKGVAGSGPSRSGPSRITTGRPGHGGQMDPRVAYGILPRTATRGICILPLDLPVCLQGVLIP